jgi:hypothetical protein
MLSRGSEARVRPCVEEVKGTDCLAVLIVHRASRYERIIWVLGSFIIFSSFE